ncbi:MAG: fibronectin type III domain-containing protein, partial [Prevotella sp.]|nr:fibronectin type III domain-containing protein [Prevotella sp.]
GMGNIERGGATSGLPRALEGARYYAQWAGAPYNVYSSKEGTDDYKDDINVRSYMTNWLAGNSPYVPNTDGKRVPIELSLAIHSDAGYAPDGYSLIGSLAVCTTGTNDGVFASGASRTMSYDLAESLLNNVTQDLSRLYGRWERRYLWDRNYSETRCPEVPSAIFETLSHQNFPDMVYAQDPNFKFNLARAIYKTVARFINDKHGRPTTIQPLAPVNFRVDVADNGKAHLQWSGVADALEPSATPTSFNIYTAIGNNGFDNGQNVRSNSVTMELVPDVQYNFRITAVNKGGESFPSEQLSVVWHGAGAPKVLVVNGFHRLSAPAVRNNGVSQGFDLNEDPGVSYGLTEGWAGAQQCFDTSAMGIEGEGGLGFGGNELAGHFVAGNDFSYVKEHTEAIASAKKYTIVSCSSKTIENGQVDLRKYDCVDLILGNEKFMSHQLKPYKTFSTLMQQKLCEYTQHNGRLLVSGSYIGSDMRTETEQQFLQNVLKLSYGGNERDNKDEHVTGLGKQFHLYRTLNKYHYACTSPDILNPLQPAFCAMQYGDGLSAGIAYNGTDYKLFVTGFPIECIKEQQLRNTVMRGIVAFLLK